MSNAPGAELELVADTALPDRSSVPPMLSKLMPAQLALTFTVRPDCSPPASGSTNVRPLALAKVSNAAPALA